jgi:polyisoprenoid-binding protein YceI
VTLDVNSAHWSHEQVAFPAPGNYDVDLARSYLGFSIRNHMVSRVRGQFRSFRGTLTVADDPAASSLVLEIDTASIDTGDARRDERLRSPDFLDVDRYPTMPYRSRRVWPVFAWAPDGLDRWHIEGDFVRRGVSQPLDFEVRFEGGLIDPNGTTRVGFTARAEIFRDDSEISWKQALDIDETMVNRNAIFELEIEAVRRPAALLLAHSDDGGPRPRR